MAWVVGLLIILGHYLITKSDLTPNYYLRFLQINLAAHLMISVIPFIFKKETLRFWQYNKILFLNILEAFLYASVFFIGISIALATVNYLFDANITYKVYLKFGIFSVFIFQTWHFLAAIPVNLQLIPEIKKCPKRLKIFTQYMLIPLVTLYSIILYSYMTKIVITWSLPRGLVAWMVSIMSLLGIFNILLLFPVSHISENKWIKNYSKYFYIMLLPLLVMLFIAVARRIGDYGVTEQRYFLFILASWLAGLCCYYIFSKVKSIMLIPSSLMFLALLTAAGPWGAYSVSMTNQLSRLKTILKILAKYAYITTKSQLLP